MAQVKISTNTSGDNALMTDPGSLRTVKLRALFIVSAADVTIKFTDGAGDLTGAWSLKANIPLMLPFAGNRADPYAWLTTTSGALNINLATGVQVSGWAIVES